MQEDGHSMSSAVSLPYGDTGLRLHVPTGWVVDPIRGHVYGTRQVSVGRRLGGPDHRGRWRIIRRRPDGTAEQWGGAIVVWEAATGQRLPDGHTITHRNGDKGDCRFANLVLTPRSIATHAGTAKLTPDQVIEIRASSDGPAALAARYGVTPGTIWHVRHVGWRDVEEA